MLTRDAGPSGWTELNATRYELDGWEIFEGDDASPHQCRGWFRCTAVGFTPATRVQLNLHLVREDGTERQLAVRLERKRTTEPEWEFRAER